MIQDVHPLSPLKESMVGEAFTLRYMPAREDLNPLTAFRDRPPAAQGCRGMPAGCCHGHGQPQGRSRGICRGHPGHATHDTRRRRSRHGWRLPQITAEIASLGFPAFHSRPSAPTNLTLHQAIEINGPIGCGDAPVFPGDVMVGDADGVIVLPAHLVDELADEATEMTAFEDFVTERVRGGSSILGLYPPTDERTLSEFAAWRKDNGR